MMPLNGASCSWLTVQNRQHLPKRVHVSSSRITAPRIIVPYLDHIGLTHAKDERVDTRAICPQDNICGATINNLQEREGNASVIYELII